ncbi:hypothetical protein [Dictyobacter alpinus]|uniref:hypothetical protein n=1 Tax=Dictyobacter alpinus TaxID=2014873 RepID=UPI000F838B8F|nr:hypothetical protein [Dictyobacter alpinus]
MIFLLGTFVLSDWQGIQQLMGKGAQMVSVAVQFDGDGPLGIRVVIGCLVISVISLVIAAGTAWYSVKTLASLKKQDQSPGRGKWWFSGRREKKSLQESSPDVFGPCRRPDGTIRVTRTAALRDDARPLMQSTRERRGRRRTGWHVLKRTQPTDRLSVVEGPWHGFSDTPFFYTSYQDRLYSQPFFQGEAPTSANDGDGPRW